jgi:hypothetical protein
MIREIPFTNRGVVWINRGPLWRKNSLDDALRLLEMLRALREYWVTDRSMYLLVAPPLYKDEIGTELLSGYGFAPSHRSEEWASARIALDLPLEELRRNLDKKWRNCLGKAERSGLLCRSGTEDSIVEYILREYAGILRHKKLRGAADPDLLRGYQTLSGEHNKLRGFIAYNGDEGLGGVLVARYGNTCEYIVGAVTDKGKSLDAGNFLLWQAISSMKGLGCKWFDLGGMHPVKTPAGIFHFKNGLGGQPYSLVGNFAAYEENALNRIISWRLEHM